MNFKLKSKFKKKRKKKKEKRKKKKEKRKKKKEKKIFYFIGKIINTNNNKYHFFNFCP